MRGLETSGGREGRGGLEEFDGGGGSGGMRRGAKREGGERMSCRSRLASLLTLTVRQSRSRASAGVTSSTFSVIT